MGAVGAFLGEAALPKEIEAHFDITHETLSPATLRHFLEWLNDFQGGKWRPERYNNAEPIKYPYSPAVISDVTNKWIKENIGMVLKRTSAPKYELDFGGQHTKLLVKNELTIYLDSALFQQSQDAESCLTFLNALYMTLRPAYGYSVHRKNYLAKNMQIIYPEGGNVSSMETWVGRDLSKCLRGIYWANWFGPVYVEFFGEERLESAPCFRKERLSNGGYLILTAATPMEYEAPQAREIEEAVRDHLGADAFFDIRAPHRLTRSPWSSRFVT
jgi:hypothetical protein